MSHVFVPTERSVGETRVAATPDTVRRLLKAGFTVSVEHDAGVQAHISDGAYAEAGAALVMSCQVSSAWSDADVVLKVAPPSLDEVALMREGALLIGFLSPSSELDVVRALRDRGVTAMAMELVPRISRAQTMDALSSQASIAGYKAVLLAASRLDRYFPLLMTAAGTVQPSRVVVLGAGVAGLQAIATARRLGASVEVSDIRPAVKEQVESLGGKFIEIPMHEDGEDADGYAKQLTPEQLEEQRLIVRERIIAADAVITTAVVPGRKAPILIPAETVEAMRPGAIIVDLAVAQGGNCELSVAGEDVVAHGVTILGHPNLPATLATDASMLYSRNVSALLLHLADDEANVAIDPEDPIAEGATLTRGFEVLHPPTALALEGESAAA